MKEELLEAIAHALEALKDFNQYKHLFSDDTAESTLAGIRHDLKKVKLLLALNEIKDVEFPKNKPLEADPFGMKAGTLVTIRPCGEEYSDNTYLGLLIGDIALGSSISIGEDAIRCNFSNYNPAILVPSLGKVIYGMESWWGEIKSEADFDKITDKDIQDIWYVKLWKSMNEKEENK